MLDWLDAHTSLVVAAVLVACYTDFRLSVRPLIVRGLAILEALGVMATPDAIAKGTEKAESEVKATETSLASLAAPVLRVLKGGGNGVAVILLSLALLAGCVASDVRQASARAHESASKLREGWEALRGRTAIVAKDPADAAAVASLSAILDDRFRAHEEQLGALQGVANK